MTEVRTFADRFERQTLTDVERVLPVDGQLSALRESLTGRSFDSPAQPAQVLRVSFYGVGEPPNWLQAAVREIGALRELNPDWDSYGARPADVKSMVKALEVLSWALNANSSRPAIAPAKRSGVQLSWRTGRRTLEIVATASGTQAYFFDEDLGEEWETDLAQGADRVMGALRSFNR
jgi:hypothetical protein